MLHGKQVMMIMMASKKQNKQIGNLGEQLAANYLKKQGFSILNRNYLKKWGEIDIVARGTNKKVHFVEVKTVSHETREDLEDSVSRETWRPEEQVHERKLHQIHKAIESWLSEYHYEGDWQTDVLAVRMVPREKFATVNLIEDVL